MVDTLQSIFLKIRDIPYSIPLDFNEEDNCCSGKSTKLVSLFQNNGFKARLRVCVFLWEDLHLPPEVIEIPHDKDCTHTYAEVYLNKKWVRVDATWDPELRKAFHINDWDGVSDTSLAVRPIKTFSPKRSAEIMQHQSKQAIDDDLSRNREFYRGLNAWFEKIRNS